MMSSTHASVLLLLGVVISAGWGIIGFRSRRSGDWLGGAVRAFNPFMLTILGANLVATCLMTASVNTDNNMRLAPSVAWAQGHAIYHEYPSGPMVCQIYPPASVVAYAPAALFGSPYTSLAAAAAMAMAYSLIPILLACWSVPFERPFRLLLFGAIILVIASSESLRMACLYPRPDAPAFGLLLIAILISVRPGPASPRMDLLAALCIALSIFCKQTMAPAAVAVPAVIAVIRNTKSARRIMMGTFACLLILLGVSLAFFGPLAALRFCLLDLPKGQAMNIDLSRRTLDVLVEFERELRFAGLLLATFVVWRTLGLSRVDSDHGAPTTETARQRPAWILPAVIAALMVPVCLMQRYKTGGVENAYALTTYFLLAAVIFALRDDQRPTVEPARSRSFIFTILLFLSVPMTLALTASTLPLVRDAVDVRNSDVQRAFEFLQSRPGEVFFPNHPLASIMAERRLYHSDEGLGMVMGAGHKLSAEAVLAYLPVDCHSIAMPARWGRAPFFLESLPEFKHKYSVDELPGWTIYSKRPMPAESPENKP